MTKTIHSSGGTDGGFHNNRIKSCLLDQGFPRQARCCRGDRRRFEIKSEIDITAVMYLKHIISSDDLAALSAADACVASASDIGRDRASYAPLRARAGTGTSYPG